MLSGDGKERRGKCNAAEAAEPIIRSEGIWVR